MNPLHTSARRLYLLACTLICPVGVLISPARAGGDPPSSLSISWFTVDCGGGTSSGPGNRLSFFTLSGTVGQHDAGVELTTDAPGGHSYSLVGGFWSGAGSAPPVGCPPDFNGDGTLNPDDLTDYIGAFFSVPPGVGSDYNSDGTTDPDDLADYISAFFVGCA